MGEHNIDDMATRAKAETIPGLFVLCRHRGNLRAFSVRDVTVDDEEAIEDAFPLPPVPMVDGPTKAKIPDFTDMTYIAASQKVERTRRVARIACALTGGERDGDVLGASWFAGATAIKERTAKLKAVLQTWQVEHFGNLIRFPDELTEDDVVRRMHELSPTMATEGQAS